ncbi:MAG: hypothetical protein HKN36_03305 [Hellea sp.]|nr:hypothetical protein [Hellea sp.]
MYQKYQLRQPAKRYARIGAFYACLLPVIIGLMFLVGTFGQAFEIDKALNLPISLAFLFGTPIVAWLSQSAITRRKRLDYWNLVEVALLRATIVQIIIGLSYAIFYTSQAPHLIIFADLLRVSLTAHTILWATITLPLTLICCLIFKHSALRPIYR